MPDQVPPARAREIVARFALSPVLVVGDVMVDQFIVGQVERISPEAPVPIVRFASEHRRVGGSANVAHNVRALGGPVELAGVVGGDEEARALRRDLAGLGIGQAGLVEAPGRRTTKKVRLVTTRNLQVARVDYEQDDEIPAPVADALLAAIEPLADRASVLVVSDYHKGTITRRVAGALVALGRRRGVPVLVDPKVPHMDYYAGATLITPNHHEAEAATQRRIRTTADARAAARALRDRVGCDAVLITRGDQGMWLLDSASEAELPAVAREVADVTGAGDTVIAALALALAAGATLGEAAVLANAAAGVTVGKFGPATLTQEELLSAL